MNLRAAAMNFNIQALSKHGIRLSMSSTDNTSGGSPSVHDSAVTEQAEQLASDDNIIGATRLRSYAKLSEHIARQLNGDASRLSTDRLARGPVGETCLHICFLVCEPENIVFAKWLLSLDPSLINTVYQESDYHGENVLHMAIVGVAKGKLTIAGDKRTTRSTDAGHYNTSSNSRYAYPYPPTTSTSASGTAMPSPVYGPPARASGAPPSKDAFAAMRAGAQAKSGSGKAPVQRKRPGANPPGCRCPPGAHRKETVIEFTCERRLREY